MPAKRIFFISRSPPPDEAPTDYMGVMAGGGKNTGNLFFMDALRRQLQSASSAYSYKFDPEEVGRDYDYLAIPAANWIASGNKMPGLLVDLIERTNLPVLIAGLGAQSFDMERIPVLGDDAKRFLAVLSERAKAIGVRGAYTLRVLESYGVKNAVVAGCPSYFWRLEPNIAVKKSRVGKPVIAVNASRDRIVRPTLNAKREIEKALYNYLFHSDESVFVAQTEKLEICLGTGMPRARIPQEYFDSFRQSVDPAMTDEAIEAQRDKLKVFTSIPEWMDQLSRVDFVIGTRLHGCLMGVVAGVPTMLISIDSRTREVAEYFKVPTVSIQDLGLPLDVAKLYDQLDMTETVRVFPERFRVYREFLEANGVPHNLMPHMDSVGKDAHANADTH